ncbi:hypothetical protein ACH4TV_09835 [Streptomyces sp. NPDC020898]|uniref:hypothetical protein n=1 Tax=Streptomyces sp. NPDC020898 TaxID=3365101 RepID=UPI0037AAE31B
MTDPNFSGINPDNLLRTISALESGGKKLHGAKAAFLSRFQKHGLDSSNLTEIGKIASWVDDELPMLRRRQTLAAAMETEGGYGPKVTMIQLREPVLTGAAAMKDGKELAEAANKAGDLDPSQAGAEFHGIAETLRMHKGDPDFASAFYAKMNPELLENLPLAIAAANASTAKEDTKIFGSAFTAAVNSESPAPGFDKAYSVFSGDLPKDQPGAVFNRALMQSNDPELWEVAWDHTKKAVAKLGDPADTWSDHAGLIAGIIGVQFKYADHFRSQAQNFSDKASDLHQRRLNAMTPEEKRAFKKETRRAAKAAKSSGRQAERALAKYGMGPFSRLMEVSVGDAGSWVMKSIPSVHPPSSTGAFGKILRAGGKLPLVGSILTIGAIAWDIHGGEEKDVAIAANVAGMGAGMAGTWAGMAAVAAVGGPVGWGIAAGIVVGFGVGYTASYLLKDTEIGRKAVNAVSGAAKSAGKSISDGASVVKNTVSGWFS